jgi:hypothetical protein
MIRKQHVSPSIMPLEIVNQTIILAGSSEEVDIKSKDFDPDEMTPLARDNNYSVWDEKWGEGE